MTLTTTVVRLRLVLEDENLLVLALRLNLARHLRTLDERTADLDGIAVNNRQNLIERHALALFGAELLDADDICLPPVLIIAYMKTPPCVLLADYGTAKPFQNLAERLKNAARKPHAFTVR